MPPEESVALHVRVTMAESARVRREEPGTLGVRYGQQDGDWLDLFNEQGEGQVVAYIRCDTQESEYNHPVEATGRTCPESCLPTLSPPW